MSRLSNKPLNVPIGAVPALKLGTVSVITVSYWTGPVLRDCVKAILAQPEVLELILIDNGNHSQDREWLKDLEKTEARFSLIYPHKNIGFAAGCNLGAAHSKGDYIAFVNPDCVLAPDTFLAILEVFAARKDAWLCAGRLEHPDGSEQRGGRREVLTPWRAFVEISRINRLFPNHPRFRRLHLCDEEDEFGIVETPTVSGAFMVIPRQFFDRIGGFDGHMFLHSDDVDLCLRILKMGGKILYCGNIKICHHLSTSDVSRLFIDWHKTRSTSYYFYKHFHETYPYWALSAVSLLLWLRFWLRAPANLIHDLLYMRRKILRNPKNH